MTSVFLKTILFRQSSSKELRHRKTFTAETQKWPDITLWVKHLVKSLPCFSRQSQTVPPPPLPVAHRRPQKESQNHRITEGIFWIPSGPAGVQPCFPQLSRGIPVTPGASHKHPTCSGKQRALLKRCLVTVWPPREPSSPHSHRPGLEKDFPLKTLSIFSEGHSAESNRHPAKGLWICTPLPAPFLLNPGRRIFRKMSRNRSHLYTATSCPWSSTSSLSPLVKSGPEAEAADFRPCLRGRWSKSGASKVWKSQWKGLERSPTRVLADCFRQLLCCSTELPGDPARERPRTTRTGSAVFQNLVASRCRDLRFT